MGRAPGPGEAAWLPDDTELALAWQAEQRSLCGGCGQHLDESMDPAAAREEIYEARSSRCHACAEIDRKRLDDQEKGRDLAGVRYRVIKHGQGW